MQLINFHTDSPEENIACDECLLLKAEAGGIGETLRFWESGEYFVVIGRGGKAGLECFKDKCREDGVKIIRRISGGGTVLQGPGCLNYSLILSYESAFNLKEVNSSYAFVLGAISKAFKEKELPVISLPVSDMVFKNKKFSGNAQARKKKFFLHHGTILYDFDLSKIQEYIKYPPEEPEYRQGRCHKDFVINLPVPGKEIEAMIRSSFGDMFSEYKPCEADIHEINRLVREKYSGDSWNFIF